MIAMKPEPRDVPRAAAELCKFWDTITAALAKSIKPGEPFEFGGMKWQAGR